MIIFITIVIVFVLIFLVTTLYSKRERKGMRLYRRQPIKNFTITDKKINSLLKNTDENDKIIIFHDEESRELAGALTFVLGSNNAKLLKMEEGKAPESYNLEDYKYYILMANIKRNNFKDAERVVSIISTYSSTKSSPKIEKRIETINHADVIDSRSQSMELIESASSIAIINTTDIDSMIIQSDGSIDNLENAKEIMTIDNENYFLEGDDLESLLKFKNREAIIDLDETSSTVSHSLTSPFKIDKEEDDMLITNNMTDIEEKENIFPLENIPLLASSPIKSPSSPSIKSNNYGRDRAIKTIQSPFHFYKLKLD